MNLRVLVVDDERHAREKLLGHLREERGVEIVGEAGNGLEAVEVINRLKPNLVFLDVQMPGLDGFEVIEAVGAADMPAVVFVTAFDEHALHAFEVEAVDYLLKPFDTRRFRKAFERARRRLADPASNSDGPQIARLLEAWRPGTYLTRLVVSERGRVFLVRVDTVTHMTAEGNYVRVHTASRSHLRRDTLARLERRLDPSRFARIHRSGIVAIDAVQELQPWSHGDSIVILTTGEKLRLSRRYHARLLKES